MLDYLYQARHREGTEGGWVATGTLVMYAMMVDPLPVSRSPWGPALAQHSMEEVTRSGLRRMRTVGVIETRDGQRDPSHERRGRVDREHRLAEWAYRTMRMERAEP